jgi:ABC-type cobalamin/Fe3+-siderophores transport system ATPase subunit
VPLGTIYALVGGAAKSTMIKLTMNFLRPSLGRAQVLGSDSALLAGKAFIPVGYVPENEEMPGWMIGQAMLNNHRAFYPHSKSEAPRSLVPDSEVVAHPVRRRFTAEYKRSILDQADAAQYAGAIAALLCREGLYSSHLGSWRGQRKQAEVDAFTPRSAAPK